MGKFADYETYACVYESGSFTAAARRLHMGQPAVSKAVARLEQQLGTRLMLRSTHGLQPTDAGQQLYQRTRRILNGDGSAGAERRRDPERPVAGRFGGGVRPHRSLA